MYRILLFLLLATTALNAQELLEGVVRDAEGGLPGASVQWIGTEIGTSTDADGKFKLTVPATGLADLEIRFLGYISKRIPADKIEIAGTLEIRLHEDRLGLEEVVVTGSRTRVEKYNTPVIVNTIGNPTFEATQSLTVAEGLNFSPGLRVENNCQNCGFTQLRMNGLDGAYSQVLVNNRQVFSALAGVYGLEMLPSGMVDRIEIVRGGGSVMYGGNAIAGTVNIITKDPVQNSIQAGFNQGLVNGEASDRTVNFNGSVVSRNLNKGITLFGMNRNRQQWDANGDGFSEIVKLQNNSLGFDAFYNFNDRNKLKLGTYFINEFRRGGNKFELLPHQTDVTEQLQHNILNANLSYEHTSLNLRHRLSVYAAIQHVDRASYYGGGGRIIAEGDSLTADDILAINAYGNSTDISTVSGLQYNYFVNDKLSLSLGSEFLFNDVIDEMPGYGRKIDQRVGTLGTFAELEIKPIDRLTLLIGGRLDHLDIAGNYDLQGEEFNNEQKINVLVPRVSAMFKVLENLKIRASFAQGYRGPQAFDEDLHIETVGGAARFIRINPELEVERSNSATLSLNYDKYIGTHQMNFVAEGFFTKLANPFILVDQVELPSGVAVIDKRNGSGATVAGVNLEANYAFGSKLVLQSGASIQSARYDEIEEIWAPADAGDGEATTTRRMLRTPNAYGFFSLVYNPIKPLAVSYSGVITGSMAAPHVVDVETERTILENTPVFFENNIKLAYTFRTQGRFSLELFSGVQNLFNSYQSDFDTGAERDAGYVYGPLRPRTYFMGLKFGLD